MGSSANDFGLNTELTDETASEPVVDEALVSELLSAKNCDKFCSSQDDPPTLTNCGLGAEFPENLQADQLSPQTPPSFEPMGTVFGSETILADPHLLQVQNNHTSPLETR
ncbi:hypothetical protein PIB30_007055 [Stylosanthes scabra]|uniref:Uncharacterized protein n=1 Tax=Stylosanthes scabra TaxID=79078 RepID=A0ABU6Q4I1_9FABA|nr:hypothetical protein [Stylosanthes scabra]